MNRHEEPAINLLRLIVVNEPENIACPEKCGGDFGDCSKCEPFKAIDTAIEQGAQHG